MKHLLGLIAALILSAAPAPAGSPVSLVDQNNQPLGTSNNALYVTGGTGGSGGGGGNVATTSNGTDGQATSTTNQQNVVYNYLFNGSTWDRMRGSSGFLGVLLQAPIPSGTNTIGSVNVLGGNSTAVKVDGSAVTQPVSAAVLPLPSGASTAAAQTAVQTAPGTSASTAEGIQGVTNGVPIPISGQQTAGSAAVGTGVRIMGNDGTAMRDVLTTTTGALEPVTAATPAKIVTTVTSLAASTSTQIRAADAAAVATEIQCDGTAAVAVDRVGGTLTSAAGAGATSPVIIPAGSYPLYTMPVATRTAITAYTGTAQTCRVTDYLR